VSTALEHATWAWNEADRLAAGKFPYVFGGGHGTVPVAGATFPPSGGPPKGYDCSGWLSAILWHAGLLGHQEALNTEEFEFWGVPGVGQHVTVFVLNEPQPGGIHHCFGKIVVPGKSHVWTAARHSGTICGWQDNWGDWITQGYTPRHPGP
jgi:hypothetical protein